MNKEQKIKWPSLLVELHGVIDSALEEEGFEQSERLPLTEKILRALSLNAGGRNLYLPRGKALDRALRDSRIFREFTGDNVDELSRRHSLSGRQIYSIISSQRELGMSAGQAH